MKKKDFLIVSIIVFIAICFRAYKINTPLADTYSHQQANEAAIARNLSRGDFNILRPEIDDIRSTELKTEVIKGYQIPELPLYNATIAVFVKYLPIDGISAAMYGRIITIFFSLLVIASLYYLALKEHSRTAAISASLMYAIFPFFVFHSRLVLPETMALASMLLAVSALRVYITQKKQNVLLLILSTILASIALLISPFVWFYIIPCIFLFVSKYKFDVFKRWDIYFYTFVGLIPFVGWRLYAIQNLQALPDNTGLFTLIETAEGVQNIFFQPIFFQTIFMDRIGIGVFGIYMSALFLIGIMSKFKRNLHISIVLSAFLFLLLLQGVNMQHGYYMTIILPAIAFVTGLGIAQIVNQDMLFNKIFAYPAIVIVAILSFYFSFLKVEPLYDYPTEITQIARLVSTFTRPDDKIITDTNGDTTLLYLSDRKGAAAIFEDIPELQAAGYSYLITDNGQITLELKDEGFEILVENQQFSIIKL